MSIKIQFKPPSSLFLLLYFKLVDTHTVDNKDVVLSRKTSLWVPNMNIQVKVICFYYLNATFMV